MSTDALILLKEGKVSDDVINAMLDKQSNGMETGNPETDNIINKLQQTGIFYLTESSGYTRLDPTLTSGSSTGSNLLTGTVKSKSTIDGSESNLQTTTSPVFYFYFGKGTESKLSNTSATTTKSSEFLQMIQSYSPNSKSDQAYSPNDFKLIKLDKNRNNRTFETGKISALGGVSNGVSKNVISFKYEAISPTLFKVHFPNGLPAGEYCFIYATSAASGGVTAAMMSNVYHNDMKVFDLYVVKLK